MSSRVPPVQPNDNRVPAGRRIGTTHRLSLVVRVGEWRPNGTSAPGVVVPAFAIEGGAPRIPGPLVRVPEGTTVTVAVRNALTMDTVRIHGLHARPLRAPADSIPLLLAPGESRIVTFDLQAQGTFYYWGTTMRRALPFRTGLDAQLTGAIVVDPRGVRPPPDRIFVLGMWTDTVARSFLRRNRVLAVVNGRSWPNTELLSARVSESVRWRVINASGDLHPMHLHGFYFRVTARGDGTTDTLFTNDRVQAAVTEAATMGATFAMTWVPERAGNWLFHCHIPEHFGPRAPLGLPQDTSSQAHASSHAHAGMSGMVLGVEVQPRADATSAPEEPIAWRALRLLVRASPASRTASPVFGYVLHERGPEPPIDTGRIVSPPLVLYRGEPVRITVVNQLTEPTAVHWHGIELESYFDGVPGFSGRNRRTTPLIAPRDSFEVRFTPPRAGTFIYHTHHDEDRQQAAGLAGPLIVLEPGTTLDTARDKPILITSPFDFMEASRYVLFNGQADPAPITLRMGETIRLRLINMTLRRSGIRLRLSRGTTPQPWRAVAKDGAPVPLPLAGPRAIARIVSIGETLDVEITAEELGDLRIEVLVGPGGDARVIGHYPIRVVP